MAGSGGRALLLVVTLTTAWVTTTTSTKGSRCIETWDGVLEGEFSSPNFPSQYNPNDLCVWNIQAPDETSRVVLTYEAFMLEDGDQECEKDFVEIGETKTDRMVHGPRLCGQKSRFQWVSKTNQVTVLFQSDGQNQFPGFRATFKVVPSSELQNKTAGSSGKAPSKEPMKSSIQKVDGCQCGEAPSKARRIVGGQIVQGNKFPWLVVLVTPDHETAAHCGGVLLTPKYVITAAHCTRGKTATDYRVVAGAYDLSERDSESYAIRSVARLIPHEHYNRTSEENDIALVELTKEFELNSAIQTVCLPDGNLGDLVGETTVTAGWGRVKYMGESSDVPRSVDLPVVSNAECARAFKDTDASITDNMLCAGLLDGSVDACQGDSGGPLMRLNRRKNTWEVVGVVSYGVRCATPGYYGVYTRVSKYDEWILKQIGGSLCNATLV